jgi:beta-lactam-binding protein with PASTA domain
LKRIYTLILGALAMIAVALISAFIAMRLAIHGREAVVPQLTGLTVDQATESAASKDLNLTLENRFYSSDVPAGRILAQDPAPGSRVRREWPIRITESLGTQRVSIPDLTGESERAATVTLRRLSLELGTVAHLAIAGDPDVVLTQTPPANSSGVDSPRVSLLVSDPMPDPDPITQQAYVMPSLLGLTYSAATERASTAGLHLILNPEAPATAATSVPASTAGATATQTPASAAAISTPSITAAISSQWPQRGHRVVRGDAVHITLAQPALTAAVPAP